MHRPRRNRSLNTGVILRRTHRFDGACVAVAQLEHLRGDVSPRSNLAGASEVVRAVFAWLAGLAVAVAVAEVLPRVAVGVVVGDEGQRLAALGKSVRYG